MKFIFKSVSGSFLRTLGRILCYLVLGFLIALFSGYLNIGSVSAKTSLPITNYSLATNICDWESSVTGANVTIKKCDNFSLSLNTSRTFPIPDMYSISYNGIVFNYQVSAANELYSYNVYTMQISFKVSSVNENFLNSFKVFIDGGVNGYCTTCNSVDLISYSFEKQSNTGDYVLNLKYQPNLDGIRFVAIKFLSNLSLDVVYPDLTYISDYVSSKAITTSIKSYSIYYDRTSESYQKETNSKIDETNDLISGDSSDTTSKSCGIICKLKGIFTGIIELPGKLVSLLIDALKSLFIPKNMDFINNLVDTLENKLGLIAQVPIQCIEFILNLATATWTEFDSVKLPSISIFGYNFWNAQDVDISQGISIFSTFKYVTDVICVSICVRTLFKWYEGFTGG